MKVVRTTSRISNSDFSANHLLPEGDFSSEVEKSYRGGG